MLFNFSIYKFDGIKIKNYINKNKKRHNEDHLYDLYYKYLKKKSIKLKIILNNPDIIFIYDILLDMYNLNKRDRIFNGINLYIYGTYLKLFNINIGLESKFSISNHEIMPHRSIHVNLYDNYINFYRNVFDKFRYKYHDYKDLCIYHPDEIGWYILRREEKSLVIKLHKDYIVDIINMSIFIETLLLINNIKIPNSESYSPIVVDLIKSYILPFYDIMQINDYINFTPIKIKINLPVSKSLINLTTHDSHLLSKLLKDEFNGDIKIDKCKNNHYFQITNKMKLLKVIYVYEKFFTKNLAHNNCKKCNKYSLCNLHNKLLNKLILI